MPTELVNCRSREKAVAWDARPCPQCGAIGPGRNSPRFRRQRRIILVEIGAICASVLIAFRLILSVA